MLSIRMIFILISPGSQHISIELKHGFLRCCTVAKNRRFFSTTSQAAIWRDATITWEPLAITVTASPERCRLSLVCCATKRGDPYQSKYLRAILPIQNLPLSTAQKHAQL